MGWCPITRRLKDRNEYLADQEDCYSGGKITSKLYKWDEHNYVLVSSDIARSCETELMSINPEDGRIQADQAIPGRIDIDTKISYKDDFVSMQMLHKGCPMAANATSIYSSVTLHLPDLKAAKNPPRPNREFSR